MATEAGVSGEQTSGESYYEVQYLWGQDNWHEQNVLSTDYGSANAFRLGKGWSRVYRRVRVILTGKRTKVLALWKDGVRLK